MTQSELNEQNIEELEQILEMARITETKAREMSELSTQIAHKWQRRVTAKKRTTQQTASNIE